METRRSTHPLRCRIRAHVVRIWRLLRILLSETRAPCELLFGSSSVDGIECIMVDGLVGSKLGFSLKVVGHQLLHPGVELVLVIQFLQMNQFMEYCELSQPGG